MSNLKLKLWPDQKSAESFQIRDPKYLCLDMLINFSGQVINFIHLKRIDQLFKSLKELQGVLSPFE